MTALTRPPLRYHGGKWRIAPWVMEHLPRHLVYVEPFGGGASILLRKSRARTEIYNDLDGSAVNFFKVCRDRAGELARAVALTPYARSEYNDLYAATGDPVEDARRFACRSFMGQSSKGAFEKSGFDGRMNDDHFIGRLSGLVDLPETISRVAGRMRGVVIEQCPAIALMERYDTPDTVFYVDPPYLPGSRGRDDGAGRRRVFTHDMTHEDHVKLLGFVLGLNGMVILSGYPSNLYDVALRGWRRVETDARADGAETKKTEVLWLNPACARALEAEAMPLFGRVG